MDLTDQENEIIGNWIFNGSKMIADKNCTRIEYLIQNYLLKIRTDNTGWDTLYRDPYSQRYWELIHPKSEIHGGGPPSLIKLLDEEATSKYL